MKKIFLLLLVLCGTSYAQLSSASIKAKARLKDAIAYRQEFLLRTQNSEWMRKEYGNYEMHKYSWGLRKKTADRDQLEIDIKVLELYEKYDMQLSWDANDELISWDKRNKLSEQAMPFELYEIMYNNKERVFPSSKEVCHH